MTFRLVELYIVLSLQFAFHVWLTPIRSESIQLIRFLLLYMTCPILLIIPIILIIPTDFDVRLIRDYHIRHFAIRSAFRCAHGRRLCVEGAST